MQAWREAFVKFWKYDWGFVTLVDTHEDAFVRYTAIRGRGQHEVPAGYDS